MLETEKHIQDLKGMLDEAMCKMTGIALGVFQLSCAGLSVRCCGQETPKKPGSGRLHSHSDLITWLKGIALTSSKSFSPGRPLQRRGTFIVSWFRDASRRPYGLMGCVAQIERAALCEFVSQSLLVFKKSTRRSTDMHHARPFDLDPPVLSVHKADCGST